MELLELRKNMNTAEKKVVENIIKKFVEKLQREPEQSFDTDVHNYIHLLGSIIQMRSSMQQQKLSCISIDNVVLVRLQTIEKFW